MGATVGVTRQISSLRKGLKDSYGFKGDGWGAHIEGDCGELAAAKALNRYWGGSVDTFKRGGDVGPIQVRTRSKPHYELIVREDDPDDAIFVLLTGSCPTYEVVGTIKGSEAKQPEWLKTHGGRPPAYFVPHEALNGREVLT